MAKLQTGKAIVQARDVKGSSLVTSASQQLTPGAPTPKTALPKSKPESKAITEAIDPLDAEIEALLGGVTKKATLKSDQKKPGAVTVSNDKGVVAKPVKEAKTEPIEKKANSAVDKRKLKLLVKANPHKDGSNRAEQFELLRGSKTVSDYTGAGGATKYLARWVESGHLSLD